MQVQPLDGEKWRVFFRQDEFEQLIECAKHQRARTVMYLMAISLRVKTATNLQVGQFYQDREDVWWLHVEAKDATERDYETKPREILVPPVVINQVEAHLQSNLNSLPDEKPVFDIVKRTLQRDVEDARENAMIATGIEDYLKVSSHDFRRYYASHYLFRLNVNQHVTRQMGGWKKVEHMFEYLLLPRDLVKNRLADAGVLAEDPLTMTKSGPADQVHANFDTIESRADHVGCEEVIRDRLLKLGELVDGIKVVLDSKQATPSESSTLEKGQQASLNSNFRGDESGSIKPATVAMAAYGTVLITASWMITHAPPF